MERRDDWSGRREDNTSCRCFSGDIAGARFFKFCWKVFLLAKNNKVIDCVLEIWNFWEEF